MASKGNTIAQAYVQIVPSADGINKKLEDELKKPAEKPAEDSGKKIAEKMAKGFTAAGKGLSAAITAPLVAIGGASIASFKSVHEGLEQIITKTGASGEALKGMEDAMKNITTSIPTDFATAGEAIGEVNTRFGLTGQELETLSGQFVKFADLNGTNVTQSVDSVQKALSAFGLGAEDASHMLDVLNKVGQDTGVSVDTLTNGLIQNGTAFQQMGLSADQAAIFMGQMEKSGANSETVMQGLRKALKNSAEDGLTMNEALAQLQDGIKNGENGIDGLTMAYDLFGKSGDQIYGAIQNGTLDFTALGDAAIDAGGSVSDTFEATLTPMEKFQMTLNELKILGAEVGERLLTTLQPVFERVAEGVGKLLDFWDSLSPKTQDMIIKAAMIAAAIGPILLGVGALITTIQKIQTTVKTLGAVFNAFSMGPAGLIIMAIAGAVAVGVLLYKHWDEIKAKAQELWAKIQEVFGPLIEYFRAVWDGVKQVGITIWEGIKAAIIDPIMTIWNTIKTVWETITGFFTENWDGIKQKAQTVWNVIKMVILGPVGIVAKMIIQHWDQIKAFLLNVWNGIKSVASTVWNGIKTVIFAPINTLKSLLSGAWNSIKSTASRVWNGIKDAITHPIETARDTISGIVEKIKGLFPLSIGKIFSNIKLPHFDVDAGQAPFGIGGMGRKPSFDIDWYARGAVFNGPSIIGIGEKTKEAAVPLEGRYMRPFAKAIADEMPKNSGGNSYYFGDITLDAKDLEDVKTVDEFVRMIRRAKAFA